MSIDKSLITKGKLTRHRNVLTRTERIKVLTNENLWKDGRSVFGLPKVKTLKVRKKAKVEKEKTEETEASTGVLGSESVSTKTTSLLVISAEISASIVPSPVPPIFVWLIDIDPGSLEKLVTNKIYISPVWALSIVRFSVEIKE